MHAARHTSRGVYTMFWTLTQDSLYERVKTVYRVVPFSNALDTGEIKNLIITP